MTKLTDLDSILLSTAAQRDTGSLLPAPNTVNGAGARLTKAIAGLVKRGFVEERETSDKLATHRVDDDVAYGLYITGAGNAAIGITDGDAGGAGEAPAPSPAAPDKPRVTKAGTVLALLGREDGATLADLIAATGWLPHTTRAALTGLRKKGHVLEKSQARRADLLPCRGLGGVITSIEDTLAALTTLSSAQLQGRMARAEGHAGPADQPEPVAAGARLRAAGPRPGRSATVEPATAGAARYREDRDPGSASRHAADPRVERGGAHRRGWRGRRDPLERGSVELAVRGRAGDHWHALVGARLFRVEEQKGIAGRWYARRCPKGCGMNRVRCAIYTRKSSDEGLDQAFNSLDAQREACAAYVLSQASEGWNALPDIYDDGGLSGGTLERPALQRLLADIAAGKVDIIVVYKVDRLTRSLLDFSKLVEIFDKAGVSFVSITQSFNTTTSMGRLTLNMLLSFAQFEREVTAERNPRQDRCLQGEGYVDGWSPAAWLQARWQDARDRA